MATIIILLLIGVIIINLFFLRNANSRCENAEQELISQKIRNVQLECVIRAINNMEPSFEVTSDIKEAVFYAVKASHPDNGGNSKDFIKFKRLYDSLKE